MTTTPKENAARLATLEKIVSDNLKGFIAVGNALAEIRDQQLYRLAHPSFENYVKAKWGMDAVHAYRLIAAAGVVSNLSPIGDIPQTESQARPLAKLPPEQQQAAWDEAVKTSPKVTAAAVERAVSKRLPRKKKAAARPKAIRIRVPNAIIIIERKNANVDPLEALSQAAAKLRPEAAGRVAA